MADYFTNFSFIFTLPSADAQAYALEIYSQGSGGFSGDTLPDNFPEALQSHTEDWCFEADGDTHDGKPALGLHSSNGGIDAVCAFVSHLLAQFDPKSRVTFEWSNDCSKPRLDAYGGGAALITAKKIKTMSTSEWLHKHAA